MKEKITDYWRQPISLKLWQIAIPVLLYLAYESLYSLPAFYCSISYSRSIPVPFVHYIFKTLFLFSLGFVISTILILLNRPKFAAISSLLCFIPMIEALINAFNDYDFSGLAYGYFFTLILVIASIVLCLITPWKTTDSPSYTTNLPNKPNVKKDPAFNADMLKELKKSFWMTELLQKMSLPPKRNSF